MSALCSEDTEGGSHRGVLFDLAERVGLSLRDQACGCAAAPVEQGPKSSTTLGEKNKKGPQGPFFVFLAERVGLIRSLRELTPAGRLRRPKSLRDFVEQGSHPYPLLEIKNGATRAPFSISGGEGGIRTHGTGEPYT